MAYSPYDLDSDNPHVIDAERVERAIETARDGIADALSILVRGEFDYAGRPRKQFVRGECEAFVERQQDHFDAAKVRTALAAAMWVLTGPADISNTACELSGLAKLLSPEADRIKAEGARLARLEQAA